MEAPRSAFSHSRLTTLADCPRRYRYRYLEKLSEAFQSIEAFTGTLVHETLQWLYREREESRERTAAEADAHFRAAWSERLSPAVLVVVEGETAEVHREAGASMVRRHHETTFRNDRLVTLAIEPRIETTIGGHAYAGFIDRLARDAQGMLHVIDYKTSKRVPASFDEAGPQVRAYGLLVLEKHGGLEVGLTYDFLREGTILSEVMPRSKSQEVADGLSARIQGALDAEVRGDFPARPGPTCRWCGFRERCDQSGFSGGAAATACPLCGSGLRLRIGSRSELVTCVRFPECRHAREVRQGDRERFPDPMRPESGGSFREP